MVILGGMVWGSTTPPQPNTLCCDDNRYYRDENDPNTGSDRNKVRPHWASGRVDSTSKTLAATSLADCWGPCEAYALGKSRFRVGTSLKG
jgi:hypothetical protein